MKVFILKHGWKVLAGAVCLYLISLGYGFVNDLLFQKALAAAKTEYEQRIADADAKVAQAKKDKADLAEKAARDQESLRLNADAEIRKINNVFAIFKSRTAAELRDKNATIEEVLAEKVKDEIVIVESKETIIYLSRFIYGSLFMWKISDQAIALENQKQIDALTLKFTACQQWSNKLEAKLKPKFWQYARDGAIVLGSFMLGRASK